MPVLSFYWAHFTIMDKELTNFGWVSIRERVSIFRMKFGCTGLFFWIYWKYATISARFKRCIFCCCRTTATFGLFFIFECHRGVRSAPLGTLSIALRAPGPLFIARLARLPSTPGPKWKPHFGFHLFIFILSVFFSSYRTLATPTFPNIWKEQIPPFSTSAGPPLQ